MTYSQRKEVLAAVFKRPVNMEVEPPTKSGISPFIRVNGVPYYRSHYYWITVEKEEEVDSLLSGEPLWTNVKRDYNRGVWKFRVKGDLLNCFLEAMRV